MLVLTTEGLRIGHVTSAESEREFELWLAGVKAEALRDAAEALKYPKEGAHYSMWASGVGGWLRSRATLIEEQARENVEPTDA